MTMEDSGNTQNLGGLEHRPREQRKTLSVVGIVSGRSSVQCLPVKIWRVLNKIEAYARVTSTSHHRTEPVVVIEGNGNAADNRLRVREFGLAITWNIHADLVPGGYQCPR